jgi:hypothetical protein
MALFLPSTLHPGDSTYSRNELLKINLVDPGRCSTVSVLAVVLFWSSVLEFCPRVLFSSYVVPISSHFCDYLPICDYFS